MDKSPYRTDETAWFMLDKSEPMYFMGMYLVVGRGIVYRIFDEGKMIGEGSTPWDARIAAGIQKETDNG